MNRNNLTSADDVLYAVLHIARRPYIAYWLAEHRKHPHYPSFGSLAYIFRKIFLDFFPAQLSYEELSKMPFPLIAHVTEKEGFFVLVTEVRDSEVKISVRGHEKVLSRESFEHLWDGAVLLLDTTPLSSECKEEKLNSFLTAKGLRWKKERLSRKIGLFFWMKYRMWIFGIMFLFLLIVLSSMVPLRDGFNLFFLSCGGLGMSVSALLLEYRFHRERSGALRICNLVKSNRVDCASVLDSRYARLWGWFSWSDVGFIYFLSVTVTLLLFPVYFSNYVVSLLSLLSLPVIVWLLGVSLIRLKRFCLLCCSVQILLVVSSVVGGTYLLHYIHTPVSVVWFFVFVGVVLFLAVLYFILFRAWQDGTHKEKLLMWYNYSSTFRRRKC